MRYTWRGHSLLILHNFTANTRTVAIDVSLADAPKLTDLLWTNDSSAKEHGRHMIDLPPYGYRWFRAGGKNRNVPRE
jgi:maltose alpha-D-glucosyltransferase/alpha-amylase